MKKTYFVSYKLNINGIDSDTVYNILLKDIHPVVWASYGHLSKNNYKVQSTIVILFFSLVPDELVDYETVKNRFSIEE